MRVHWLTAKGGSVSTEIPAGWYRYDPDSAEPLRYWDGSTWHHRYARWDGHQWIVANSPDPSYRQWSGTLILLGVLVITAPYVLTIAYIAYKFIEIILLLRESVRAG